MLAAQRAITLPCWCSSTPAATSSHNLRLSPVNARAQDSGSYRRVWRRRKLTKKDDMLVNRQERTPFLEEQMRKVREGGEVLSHDIWRLMLSADNRFGLVNDIAAEATEYVRNNRDEYGGTKKAILHAITNRMNDIGYHRSDGYEQSDPYKPPGYLKENIS